MNDNNDEDEATFALRQMEIMELFVEERGYDLQKEAWKYLRKLLGLESPTMRSLRVAEEYAQYLKKEIKNHTSCMKSAPENTSEARFTAANTASTPLISPEPHLGPREPMHGDAFVEFVDE